MLKNIVYSHKTLNTIHTHKYIKEEQTADCRARRQGQRQCWLNIHQRCCAIKKLQVKTNVRGTLIDLLFSNHTVNDVQLQMQVVLHNKVKATRQIYVNTSVSGSWQYVCVCMCLKLKCGGFHTEGSQLSTYNSKSNYI